MIYRKGQVALNSLSRPATLFPTVRRPVQKPGGPGVLDRSGRAGRRPSASSFPVPLPLSLLLDLPFPLGSVWASANIFCNRSRPGRRKMPDVEINHPELSWRRPHRLRPASSPSRRSRRAAQRSHCRRRRRRRRWRRRQNCFRCWCGGVGTASGVPDAAAAMDVDDAATSVAPTEAVNPGYSKVPRTGGASEARKFFTGSVMRSDTSDLSDTVVDDPLPPPHLRVHLLPALLLPPDLLSRLARHRMLPKSREFDH